MAVGVALGAFGAHALEGAVTEARLATFETGVRYQLIHGLGVLVVASVGRGTRAGWLLAAGASVFAGSLYILVLTDTPWLGAVAPIGGAAMIAGWVWWAWSLARAR
jgi:uncharacterized membrane protein YgdD (TMEM256/DUF423 family)